MSSLPSPVADPSVYGEAAGIVTRPGDGDPLSALHRASVEKISRAMSIPAMLARRRGRKAIGASPEDKETRRCV
ncbi:hypothetical protein AVW15_11065 [Chelatococcus daeguensis]|uniref:Uncharacterized protein n=1 Tax=Chelatococcus daeguensis TaxID=444444 RepID=A0AAC9JS77_9HYPH|nr:hypothetical protein BOQ54_13900 [Chelatococcus daeguensis]KZE35981.1 hypothetical protein AVW15_11065 [Chelatococcus daeguensis]